ncbi:molybdopterin-dependent oxidoreductase [Luteipulveratus mongoliensis]|uniref:Oxidoreductase n=1 Tax=Luteipulveratus mongoliensis TaxID=571913 RepID=A0A0K1JLG9_9MICO|nr:molybdopterin-dependent oxidoreductase [Luteipulveratus mongoliensis]AKU17420.1 oxidoreductase [Luteipulveratus mongoliensis]
MNLFLRRSGRAALGGVVIGAVVLSIAELFAGLLIKMGESKGEPSPVLAVGGAFVDRTPLWLKNFAVDTFGTNDKKALFVGMALVLLGLCCAIGVLLAYRFRLALVALVVLVAVAAAAVLSRPNSGGIDVVPTLLGGFAGLWAMSRWRRRVVDGDDSTLGRPSRRAVLAYGGVTLVGAGLVAAGGRALGNASRRVAEARRAFVVPRVAAPVTAPAGASLGVPGVTPFVVPQKDFYRIDTALVVPQVDPSSWRLKVHGMVEHEIEIDWETLQSKPMREAMVTLMCVSNEVGGNLNGNAIWTGWPVRELLAEARPKPGADMVLSRSTDGFTAGTPLSALTDDRNALLAIGMNREPLTATHGFPVRLVVPGLYGYVSATKWVTDLKVTTYADDMGYWTPRGWSAKGPVKTSSRIDVPGDEDRIPRGAGGVVAVAGVAWAQHRGITGVQVRVNEGDWVDARLGTEANIDAWRQWVYEWHPKPGKYALSVRARDATGAWQTGEIANPDPDGSTGWHMIRVTID